MDQIRYGVLILLIMLAVSVGGVWGQYRVTDTKVEIIGPDYTPATGLVKEGIKQYGSLVVGASTSLLELEEGDGNKPIKIEIQAESKGNAGSFIGIRKESKVTRSIGIMMEESRIKSGMNSGSMTVDLWITVPEKIRKTNSFLGTIYTAIAGY